MRRTSEGTFDVRIEQGYREGGASGVLAALTSSGAVLVLGPAGSGRSSLLADLARREAPARRVWWCRGHAVGPPSGDGGVADPDAGLGALGRDLTEQPTTLLVDDSHLLDDDALARLAWLAERRDDFGLRIVVTRRPVRPGPALATFDASLLGPSGAAHLSPLRPAAVAAWLEREGAGENADDLTSRTGGWPELIAATLVGPEATTDLVAARVGSLGALDQTIVRSVAFGLPAGSRPLLDATAATSEEVDRAIDAAGAAGLLHDGPTPVVAVAEALRELTPHAERGRIAAAVAASGQDDVVITTARHLAALDERSPAAADLFERAADDLSADRPDEAEELYEAAIAAGASAEALAAKRARAALSAGRPEQALLLVRSTPSNQGDRQEMQAVVGAAWAHLARPALAADALGEAGPARVLAAVPLVAAGRVEEARALLTSGDEQASAAAAAFAAGATAWLAGDAKTALAELTRRAQVAEVTESLDAWPDSPHALLASAAVHLLQPERAERVAHTALERAVGGRALATRHQLLLAWVALRAGRLDEADERLASIAPATVRDVMLATGLEAALALRRADPADLPKVHRDAVERWWRGDPDAFLPDLAGELAQLAARVGDDADALLAPLQQLADELGRPATLQVPLAWARVMVAVLADDAAAARRAADTLQAVVERGPDDAGRLLADAAAAFADVLAGDVDAERVSAIADRLVERGLVHEAGRLLGAAGLRSDDARAAKELLRDLRRLQSSQVRASPGRRRVVSELSAREREVARAVLEGHTHREIGAQLYISPKTVEHHVARLRQKLGATTRADLLAAIRETLEV